MLSLSDHRLPFTPIARGTDNSLFTDFKDHSISPDRKVMSASTAFQQ